MWSQAGISKISIQFHLMGNTQVALSLSCASFAYQYESAVNCTENSLTVIVRWIPLSLTLNSSVKRVFVSRVYTHVRSFARSVDNKKNRRKQASSRQIAIN